jgi:succinate dehydrogenase / fumarate reductase, iron-sulfur subunit
MTTQAHFKVYRGDNDTGALHDYSVEVEEGMVVLDAMHAVQRTGCSDLAVRWNCKAAKCGSCSAEVNGKPALMCKTRLDDLDLSKPIEVRPLKAFPVLKDLVTDVSWNYEINKMIQPFTPPNQDSQSWRMKQIDVDRAQEFRKCIECFLCQDVCHVLRNSNKKDLVNKKNLFFGPRFMVRAASLEMHPIDTGNRLEQLKDDGGIGFCNITKCCTEVCPEEIHITDNAIIPLKERVVDEFYDPVLKIWRALTGKK